MKKRPPILYLLSASYTLFSFALVWSLIQSNIASTILKSPYELSMLSLSALAVGFTLSASPLLFIALPALCYHALQYVIEIAHSIDLKQGISEVTSIPLAFWAYVLFLSMQLLWLKKTPRGLLRHRKNHWWKTPPRISTQSEAILRNQQGENILANIHNLSKSGLLLEIKNLNKSKNIERGTLLDIRFKLGSYNVVRCTGVVVRKHMDSLTQFGFKITHIDSDSKNIVSRYINHSV
ncbi:MAG: PilZ domain-containing protein [Bdellovibrionota bacterium]